MPHARTRPFSPPWAELIAGQDEDDLDSVLRIMNTFSLDKTFVSAVALLRPDGTLLLTDGAPLRRFRRIRF